ncbi:hypothetical protein Q0590_21830 [Rhodocytophaga aerolata]|uniref:DUF1328 domain-containing protein n=1 Tax=Rhodocytophaga aerolata TaxID=455078 RepID=A0ABT8RCM2_9BACT|nr:hypothetical protein [Rhodocytophaga aerolata]MDO1448933.1 hypothetical protein [Rhodocytophaga aerolata]
MYYFLAGLAGVAFGLAAGCSTFLAGVLAFFTVALVLAIMFIVLIYGEYGTITFGKKIRIHILQVELQQSCTV